MKSKSTNMRSAGRDGWDCNASELYQSLTMESVLSGASKVIKRRCNRSFFGLLKPIGRRGWPVALFSLVSVVTHMHSACGALPKLPTLDESEEVRSGACCQSQTLHNCEAASPTNLSYHARRLISPEVAL